MNFIVDNFNYMSILALLANYTVISSFKQLINEQINGELKVRI